jgi:hypothetical protein
VAQRSRAPGNCQYPLLLASGKKADIRSFCATRVND